MREEFSLSARFWIEDVFTAEHVDSLSKGVFNALEAEILTLVAESSFNLTANPVAAARVALISAESARASVRNCDLLRGLSSLAEIQKFEEEFCRQVTAIYAKVRLPHTGAKQLVNLSDLYVKPRVAPLGFEQQAAADDLRDSIGTSLRAVVLGDPGGGKSTLSTYLALGIAKGSPEVYDSVRIPFLIVLRDFAASLSRKPKTLIEFIEEICREPYNVPAPEGAIEYLLLNGRALILFDGLDELIDTALRARVVDSVHGFVSRYPTVQVVVTSRFVGYEEAPLDEARFDAFRLAPFSKLQVQQYATNWFKLDPQIEYSKRNSVAMAFIRESDMVRDLRVNPLMLSLMCGIYSADGYIPQNRADVYEKCADLLFEKWDRVRKIEVPVPFRAHLLPALYSLALWLYENPPPRKGLTRGKLVSLMQESLIKKVNDPDEAYEVADKFVGFCTGRAWVLTDVGATNKESLYSFTHRTFLEYFAARQLFRLNASSGSLYKVLQSRIERSEWDVVAQVAVQILDTQLGQGDDFLELLYEDVTQGPSPSKTLDLAAQEAKLRFAARCLAFLVPSTDLTHKVIKAVLDFESAHVNMNPSLGSVSSSPISALIEVASPDNATALSAAAQSWIKDSVKGGYVPPNVPYVLLRIPDAIDAPLELSYARRVFWNRLRLELLQDYVLPALSRDQITDLHPWVRGQLVALGYLRFRDAFPSRSSCQELFEVSAGYGRVFTFPLVVFMAVGAYGAGGRISEMVDIDAMIINGSFSDFSKALLDANLPWTRRSAPPLVSTLAQNYRAAWSEFPLTDGEVAGVYLGIAAWLAEGGSRASRPRTPLRRLSRLSRAEEVAPSAPFARLASMVAPKDADDPILATALITQDSRLPMSWRMLLSRWKAGSISLSGRRRFPT